MKERTDILTHLLLLLLILVACTADDAIKENLSHQDEYVTVRMHIPGMKAVATRAAEADNITSIVALVFSSDDKLKTVTEYTTANKNSTNENSTLHPISPISGTFTIDKPEGGDVIHFLANLPANYSEGVTYVDYLKGFITNQNKTQEDVLRNLSSRDYSKLSYWGMATRNNDNAVMDVILYRNKAMIEIKPGENCTFRQDELFIAGLDNPNNVGLLVPYKGGFNFDLDNNDYLTLPQNPEPLDTTVELTNYGAGYDNAYYVFEHENPYDDAYDDAKGLYVICKIGDDYYKVALHDEKGQPYPIIRNHKYTILVNDLDAGCKTYSEALSAEPIKPTVIETKDVVFSPNTDQTINLNGYLDVQMNAYDRTLSTLSISADGFTVSSTNGSLSGPTDNVYTYTGGSTTFRFTPNSLGTKTISFYNGQGEYLSVPETVFNVNVQGLISASADKTDLYYNATTEQTVTVTVSVPAGVENLTIEAQEFGLGGDTDGEYTYAMNSQTNVSLTFTLLKDKVSQNEHQSYITIKDAGGIATQRSVSINVKSVPTVSFSDPGNQTLYWNNGNPTSFQVQMTDVPQNGSVTVNITGASAFTITDANSNVLQLNDDTYTYTGGNTTFTIKPNSESTVGNSYNIGFSGSGTDLIVNSRNVQVTVNSSNSEMSATSGTIDMGSGQTSTIITLTKPTDIQNLKVTFNSDVFIINDNQYHTSDDYWINNNSNETIDIKFTLRNNNVNPGEYQITFANGDGSITGSTTITIIGNQSLKYSYTNTTLYMDSNPQLPVTITVPNGSTLTQLNISATGFTIKDANGNTLGTNSYTDNTTRQSGSNVTYTFIPNSTDANTITFSGSGTNLQGINDTISVEVEPAKPAVTRYTLWTGDDNISSLHVQLDEDDLNVIEKSVGRKLCYEYYMIQNAGWWKIDCRTGQNYELSGAATEIKYTAEKNQVYSFELTQADVELLKTHKTLDFSGSNGLMFTHIYIE